ncbi:MAG: hypothetical protein KGS61_13470 [Verrucomicrobia bacterium]|nr:hypothetical protein [Verrucomicrobiota bacterium]
MNPRIVDRLFLGPILAALAAWGLFAHLAIALLPYLVAPVFGVTFVVLWLFLRRRSVSGWPARRLNLACLAVGAGVIGAVWLSAWTLPLLFPEQANAAQANYQGWLRANPPPGR